VIVAGEQRRRGSAGANGACSAPALRDRENEGANRWGSNEWVIVGPRCGGRLWVTAGQCGPTANGPSPI
jgi:hypothetical protein